MKPPVLLITLGDVAGIGPEIVVKAWAKLLPTARPVVVGDARALRTAARQLGLTLEVREVEAPGEGCTESDVIPVIPGTTRDLSGVTPGEVSAEAGGAAYDFLIKAIDLTLAGEAEGVVTCPLNKEGLALAGVGHPGHTEILAERTKSPSHAMLLFDAELPLAVAHVTLHQSLKKAVEGVTVGAVLEKIRLLSAILPRLTGNPARVGVCALNPHAGDGGLFGDEERTVIAPAVAAANAEGIFASGPYPADAIFLPHLRAQFDGVVAMVHDQGHIAMKLLGGRRAVNVTAGLPIVRTSVAHGTAYDIAGRGVADESSLVSAVAVAARLARAAG